MFKYIISLHRLFLIYVCKWAFPSPSDCEFWITTIPFSQIAIQSSTSKRSNTGEGKKSYYVYWNRTVKILL